MVETGFLGTIDKTVGARLRAAMAVQNHDRGNFVIAQDDRTDDVFFLLTGRARAQTFSRDGKMVSYRQLEAGAIFGELAAVDATPRSASVIALDSLAVGRIAGPVFREMVETDPALMWAVMRHMSGQVRRMTERVFEFSTLVVKNRLLHELVRLARDVAATGNSAVLAHSPTHAELAAAISTHREGVSREMSKLAKQGLIRKDDAGLHVLDIKALETLWAA